MQKRSLSIAGHRTSIALEPAFWAALAEMANEEKISIPALVERIDKNREGDNLSSAIRVAILERFRQKCAQFSGAKPL